HPLHPALDVPFDERRPGDRSARTAGGSVVLQPAARRPPQDVLRPRSGPRRPRRADVRPGVHGPGPTGVRVHRGACRLGRPSPSALSATRIQRTLLSTFFTVSCFVFMTLLIAACLRLSLCSFSWIVRYWRLNLIHASFSSCCRFAMLSVRSPK